MISGNKENVPSVPGFPRFGPEGLAWTRLPYLLEPDGYSADASELQSKLPGTPQQLKNSIYNNNALLQRINDCLEALMGSSFNKFGTQTSQNAPVVNGTLTSEQIATQFQMGAPPYATGVGDVGGPHGTIFIGSQFFADPSQWTLSRPDLPGRTPLQNAYVHELGNLASYYGTQGTPKWGYDMFGISGDSDADSGYQLQLCVFPAVDGFSARPFNGPI